MIQRYEKIFTGCSVLNIQAKREIRNQISLGEEDKKTLNLQFGVANKSEGFSDLLLEVPYLTIHMYITKNVPAKNNLFAIFSIICLRPQLVLEQQ